MKESGIQGNLPPWPTGSAAQVYSRAYLILSNMAKRGHVTQHKTRGRTHCSVSEEMERLIIALNEGNEETVKGLLLQTHIYY